MEYSMKQEKNADPDPGSDPDLVFFTGDQSDQAGKKGNMEEQVRQHGGFFRQPAGQR